MFDINQKPEKYMNLIVTHQCNMKCPFCVDSYRGQDEYMSLLHVAKAIEVAAEQDLDDILIIGGEPTLHPHITKIAAMVKQAGFNVIMTTNYTKPEVVCQLDGIVDSFNISWYHQKRLPLQRSFYSDLTLHALIHDRQLQTKHALDAFIDTFTENGHLKFSTLAPCNDWAAAHNYVPYLDELPCEHVTLFDSIPGQLYRGAVIKRYDTSLGHGHKLQNHGSSTGHGSGPAPRHAPPSPPYHKPPTAPGGKPFVDRSPWMAHVDGEISRVWERSTQLTVSA